MAINFFTPNAYASVAAGATSSAALMPGTGACALITNTGACPVVILFGSSAVVVTASTGFILNPGFTIALAFTAGQYLATLALGPFGVSNSSLNVAIGT